MHTNSVSSTTWRKSSHSGGQSGQCIEVAQLPDAIGLRDSKNPTNTALSIDQPAFRHLIHQIKAGKLDLA
ncbi:DUF397 domain-containing protein [Actinomadura craniellae]|uniref:DUF397 domain-containing protein n=1 Tax=Actinomadura craniellae TaxID=2231787 RepID=A0A365H1D0_9ACTN|nr:DUF397 domain-containing protein [Actinomadura craniellae]RAY12904.1 DUF397 domain-containing protein [Actinomadura craniellae]